MAALSRLGCPLEDASRLAAYFMTHGRDVTCWAWSLHASLGRDPWLLPMKTGDGSAVPRGQRIDSVDDWARLFDQCAETGAGMVCLPVGGILSRVREADAG